MSCQATAAMISTMLYYRRFFPFYVYNIVGGIDEEGLSHIFIYFKNCYYSYNHVEQWNIAILSVFVNI